MLPPKSLKLEDRSKQVKRSQQRLQISSQIMAVIRQLEIQAKERGLLSVFLLPSNNFSSRGRNLLSVLLYNISSVRTEPIMTQQGVLYFTCISDAIDSR